MALSARSGTQLTPLVASGRGCHALWPGSESAARNGAGRRIALAWWKSRRSAICQQRLRTWMRAMSDGHGLPGESEIDGAANSDRDRGGLRLAHSPLGGWAGTSGGRSLSLAQLSNQVAQPCMPPREPGLLGCSGNETSAEVSCRWTAAVAARSPDGLILGYREVDHPMAPADCGGRFVVPPCAGCAKRPLAATTQALPGPRSAQ
jgi:hypothetical protein